MSAGGHDRRRALLVKAVIDRVGAAVGLVLLSPVLLLLAVLVRIWLGSPVLFRQLRPGYRGRPFELVKFRSMREAFDPAGEPLPDELRLTAFGRFLRSTSLDELPQLWNVLKGELSLVGPRPLLVHYLQRYNARQARRHEVMPGITGWCQVNGRNALDWSTKLELDVWYVENWSLWLDLRILASTLGKVVRRSGVTLPGHASTCEFVGCADPEVRSGGGRRDGGVDWS